MKKFFIIFFILIVLGGVCFFFGWAQLEVPQGSYGVIISKIYGVDPNIVKVGEFRWLWYKLIPTNVKISVFKPQTVKIPIDFNSSLPSGDNYASFAGMNRANVKISVFKPQTVKIPIDFNSSLPSGDNYASFAGMNRADFSWNLRGEVSFGIEPEMLVSLVSGKNITDQEALDAYLQDLGQSIKVIILRTLSSVETDDQRLERILSGNTDTRMEQEIKNRFPEIRDFSFVITSARFPDFTLYRQVRLLYEEFMSKQRELVSNAFGKRAESHIEIQLRFIELEGYGELLTKYPVLLDYLALTGNK